MYNTPRGEISGKLVFCLDYTPARGPALWSVVQAECEIGHGSSDRLRCGGLGARAIIRA
jgi:hypothetical protein